MEVLADRLRDTLEEKQVSQSELARRINKSHNVVNSYCSGSVKPPVDVLVLICQELDVSADYLLGLVNNRRNSWQK